MNSLLSKFERIVRRSYEFTEERPTPSGGLHPFEERNIDSKLPDIVRKLFDDGHYSQATFEAFKFIDKEIQRHANSSESGYKLMMKVFRVNSPILTLNNQKTQSEKDEQHGFQFLFAGAVLAIRNPRGHECGMVDSPDMCLDHLSFASMLLRRLEESGYI